MSHWSRKPFEDAVEALAELAGVLQLSTTGLSQLSRSVELVEAVTKWDEIVGREIDPSDKEFRLERARDNAEFAQKEMDRGFPVLHAHAVTGMWGLLEAFIEDLVVAFLENDQALLATPALANIKIPLAEYEQLEPTDRLRFLVDEFGRGARADLKQGVSRFETLLSLVGMSGAVPDATRRDLYELSQVRNVLVHRAGMVDRRLANSCPWLGVKPGERLRIQHSDYTRYSKALEAYIRELLCRAEVYRGETREEAEERFLHGPSNVADA